MFGKKFYLLFVFVGLLHFACKPAPVEQKKPAEPEVKEKVKVDFHVMSKCPFAFQVENAIKPVLDQIGKYVDFSLHFIGNVEADGNLTSMKGETEVKGNMIQICASKHEPQKSMDFILCMSRDMRNIPANWEACANQHGLDVAKLKACYEGPEGKQLLSESFNRSKAVGARGSPTMFIGGERYQGGRQPDQFLRAICEKFSAEKPDPCKNLPEPKKINMTVLTDRRCKECMPDRTVTHLKNNIFPGLIVRTLDYSDPEGKKLYDEIKLAGVTLLPAFLFEKSVREDPGYQEVQRFMKEAGPYFALQIGARFDPTAEICDNQQDDTGDGLVDCADPTCKEKVVCREEKKGQLEVFVMSNCPFTQKGLSALKEVLANVEGVKFDIHFIADENPDGSFRSMRGQPEIEENIRWLCAKKHYGKKNKYLDFIWCRSKEFEAGDKTGNWEKCAKESGLDVNKMKACATGDEGKKLHSEDIKLAKAVGITGSPTWFANNLHQFTGIAAEQIKQNFCKYNPGTKGCEKTLSSDTGGKPAAGTCH